MSLVLAPESVDPGTTSHTSFPVRPRTLVVLVTGMLTAGTSSAGFLPTDSYALGVDVLGADATSSTVDLSREALLPEPPVSPREGLVELRRLGGLTWEQVARLFGVSRRSAHFWASGKPMTAEHEEHLHRLLAVFRQANTDADTLRARLLAVSNGASALDRLAERRYRDGAAALGIGTRRAIGPRTPLSPEAAAARRPLAPDVLAGGADDVNADARERDRDRDRS